MRPLSIRARLTAWYAIVLLAGLTLFASGIWFTLRARLIETIDATLAQRLEGLRTVAQIEGVDRGRDPLAEEFEEFAREVPDGSLIEVRNHSGEVVLPLTHVPVYTSGDQAAREPYTISLRGRPVRARSGSFSELGETYSVVVGAPLDNVDAMMRELRNLAIAIIPAVLLIAGLGGFLLSRRALTPVDQITQVARSISEQNLSARLPIPGTRDELERMSQAWNDVLERLQSALDRIGRFTADASHELRTPIALIRGSAELALRRNRTEEEYRASLSQIQTHAERMTELTESLLTLARADAVGPSMPLEPADLTGLIHDTVREASTIAAQKGINLESRTPARILEIPMNLAAIRRLLMVLVDNALKFTPVGGKVTVSLSEDAQSALLAVTDSGPGMEPSVVAHIFERFYCADAARGNSGTGLGLPIAQVIAQAHGTTIEVESAAGRGSQFQVRLKKQA